MATRRLRPHTPKATTQLCNNTTTTTGCSHHQASHIHATLDWATPPHSVSPTPTASPKCSQPLTQLAMTSAGTQSSACRSDASARFYTVACTHHPAPHQPAPGSAGHWASNHSRKQLQHQTQGTSEGTTMQAKLYCAPQGSVGSDAGLRHAAPSWPQSRHPTRSIAPTEDTDKEGPNTVTYALCCQGGKDSLFIDVWRLTSDV
jgi:hypothetical protein